MSVLRSSEGEDDNTTANTYASTELTSSRDLSPRENLNGPQGNSFKSTGRGISTATTSVSGYQHDSTERTEASTSGASAPDSSRSNVITGRSSGNNSDSEQAKFASANKEAEHEKSDEDDKYGSDEFESGRSSGAGNRSDASRSNSSDSDKGIDKRSMSAHSNTLKVSRESEWPRSASANQEAEHEKSDEDDKYGSDEFESGRSSVGTPTTKTREKGETKPGARLTNDSDAEAEGTDADQQSSLSNHSHRSAGRRRTSTLHNAPDSMNDSRRHSLEERKPRKSSSTSSSSHSRSSSRVEGKERAGNNRSSLPVEQTSRSSTPKSFASSSRWRSRSSHSTVGEKASSRSSRSEIQEYMGHSGYSRRGRGFPLGRIVGHRMGPRTQSRTNRGSRRSHTRKGRVASGGHHSSVDGQAAAARRGPELNASQTSPENGSNRSTHSAHHADCTGNRPLRVPENEEELSEMLKDNERMKNELFRIHRGRLHEENQRKRRGVREAKESSLSSRDQYGQLVQAMIMDDYQSRLLRSEQKALLHERDEIQQSIKQQRQAFRYKSLLEKAKAMLQQATEEHHDLALEVRCNEKLLLMNANVMETGEGAFRLREELRSQNSLIQRELQHSVRDLEETEKQKKILEEEVNRLQDEVERLRSEKKEDHHEEIATERRKLEELKKKKKALTRQHQTLQAAKEESKGAGKRRKGATGNQGRRRYAKEKQAEKEYLESRIHAMRSELEQMAGHSSSAGPALGSTAASPPSLSAHDMARLSPPLRPPRPGARAGTRDALLEDDGLAGHEARLAAKEGNPSLSGGPLHGAALRGSLSPSPTPSSESDGALTGGYGKGNGKQGDASPMSCGSAPWLLETRNKDGTVDPRERKGTRVTPSEEEHTSNREVPSSAGKQRVSASLLSDNVFESASANSVKKSNKEDPPEWLEEKSKQTDPISSDFFGGASPSLNKLNGEHTDTVEGSKRVSAENESKYSINDLSDSSHRASASHRSPALAELLEEGTNNEIDEKGEATRENEYTHQEEKGSLEDRTKPTHTNSDVEEKPDWGGGMNHKKLSFLDDDEEEGRMPVAPDERTGAGEENQADSTYSSDDFKVEGENPEKGQEEDGTGVNRSTRSPTLDELLQDASEQNATNSLQEGEKTENIAKNTEEGDAPDWLDF